MTTPKRDIHLDQKEMVRRTSPVVTALVLGGLLGAGAMMLLAPYSGKETRSRIQGKASDLRDRTVGGVKGAARQVTSRTGDLKDSVMESADGLQKHARDMLARELDNVAAAAKRARKVVES